MELTKKNNGQWQRQGETNLFFPNLSSFSVTVLVTLLLLPAAA
jgi:hypothetical protein